MKRKIDHVTEPDTDFHDFVVRDVRCTYAQLLLNTFNTCDVAKLKRIFRNHCSVDLYSISSYEGASNPFAPQVTEVRTIENHISLWSALFNAVPDFMFNGEFVEAYIDPETKRCIVKSKYKFSGTRIMDLIVSKRVNVSTCVVKKVEQVHFHSSPVF